MFSKTGVRYDGITHMVDWFPTLAEVAGSDYNDPSQDGVSQWQSLLSLTVPSKRDEVVYNLDNSLDPLQGKAAIRIGDYKLIAGYPGLYPDWYEPAKAGETLDSSDSSRNGTSNSKNDDSSLSLKNSKVDAPVDYFLFNLKDDPTEHNNLYDQHPDIVTQLTDRLNVHLQSYVHPNFPAVDPDSDPDNWGGVWTPGWC